MSNYVEDKGGFLRCIDVISTVDSHLGMSDAQMYKLQDILRMMPRENIVNPYYLYSLLIFFKSSVFEKEGKDMFVSDIEDIIEMCKVKDMFKYDVLNFIKIKADRHKVIV